MLRASLSANGVETQNVKGPHAFATMQAQAAPLADDAHRLALRLKALGSGTRSSASHARARLRCIKEIAQFLLDDEGRLKTANMRAVIDVLQPGATAERLLGRAGAHHVCHRLRQFEVDPLLAERIGQMAQMDAVHLSDAAKPLVMAQAGRFSAIELTNRDMGMVVLTALLDTVRQGNAPSCWLSSQRIQTDEGAPGDVLDAVELMLSQGVTEAPHPDFGSVETVPNPVPIDEPAAWKVKLRMGTITLGMLMDTCPACLVLGDLLNVTPLALAERFTQAAKRIGTGRFIAVGELIETVVNAHFQQPPGVRTGQAALGTARVQHSDEELIDITLNATRNHMAAQEHNLLLASWAMTVPLTEQQALSAEILTAVTNELASSMGERYPADLMVTFTHTFMAEVRHVFGPTHGRHRDIVPSLRSRHGHPRIDAIGAEPFRRLLLDVLERSVRRHQPRSNAASFDAVKHAIAQAHFVQRVIHVFRGGDPLSKALPWIVDGMRLKSVQDVKSIGPEPAPVFAFTLRLQLPGSGWHELRVPHRPPQKKQMVTATLEGWLLMTTYCCSAPAYGIDALQHLSEGPLLAASHGHRFRALFNHRSLNPWIQSLRDSSKNGDLNHAPDPAQWVEKQVIQPAIERASQRYADKDMRRILFAVLERIPLSDGIEPHHVVNEVLKRCDRGLQQASPPRYRLALAIKLLARLLREPTPDGTPWSSARNVRKHLAAAVQLLPEMGGGMVVYGDSNWHSGDREPHLGPREPIMFGFAYDIVTRRLRHFELVEDNAASSGTGIAWCAAFDLPEFFPA